MKNTTFQSEPNNRTSQIYIFLLGKALEKQTEKQTDTLKYLNFFNKKDESNQIKKIYSQNQINDLIIDWLKEINRLPHCIEFNNLDYKAKGGKNVILVKSYCLLYF